MSLSDILGTTLLGESDRLDYVIREHEKLEQVVQRLMTTLTSKGIMTTEEIASVIGDDKPAGILPLTP